MATMKQVKACILTINGGSSSIKFALFEAGDSLQRILAGSIERIGLPDSMFVVKGLNQVDNFTRSVTGVNPSHRRQRERFSNIKSSNIVANADMRVGEIRQFCKLDEAGRV
jgi:acetate kinase